MPMVRILYFAWVRERIGSDGESVALAHPMPLADLVSTLRGLGDGHDRALSDLSRLRAAINQDFVPWDAEVKAGDEVAIFPPVTGG